MTTKRSPPLCPEDLELLDYIIARAIDSCIEARRKSTRRPKEQPVQHAA